MKSLSSLLLSFLLFPAAGLASAAPITYRDLSGQPRKTDTVDAEIARLMAVTKVPGLAFALIEDGKVVYQHAYGYADVDAKTPLATDTVMYGASLTKAAFAHLFMQLADDGLVALDEPLTVALKKPLPDYPDFSDLRTDARWQRVTPRMLLSHSSGLINWRWINEDRKLDFKFDPGTRYVYSGEGIQILQLIAEERTGTPLAELMQRRIFDRFGMKDTSMSWRADFAAHLANTYDSDGKPLGHNKRSRARAAGSMDTTLADYARFFAGMLRGDGLSEKSWRAMLSPQLAIVSPQQFPSHWPGVTDVNKKVDLSMGLGWVLFKSTAGPAFFKEGSDDGTNNLALGFVRQRSGIVMLSNSSNTMPLFFPAVQAVYGKTCLPWFWMGYIPYDKPELRAPGARDKPVAACAD